MSKRTTNTNLITTLAGHTAKDPNKLLGDVVWWQISGDEIDHQLLTDIWSKENLPLECLPDPPTAERAFRAAVKAAQVGQPDRLLRVAEDDENHLVIGIVAEQRHAADLLYNVEAKITLEHGTEKVHTDAPWHPIVRGIQDRFQASRGTHPMDDVRRAVVRTLELLSSIQLRSSGGVLFTPAPGAEIVRRLQAAIQQIGNSQLFLLPISDTAESQATLSHVARRSLEEDLADLRAELEAFVATPPERESTLIRRLEQFAALRARGQLLSTVLQVQVSDLDQEIRQLENTVGQLIDAKHSIAA